MILVEILNGRGQCIWDGELYCLPNVGHVLKIDGKSLIVYKVEHTIRHKEIGIGDEHFICVYTHKA